MLMVACGSSRIQNFKVAVLLESLLSAVAAPSKPFHQLQPDERVSAGTGIAGSEKWREPFSGN